MAVNVKFIGDVASWLAALARSEDAVDDNQDALEDLMRKSIELGRQTGRTTEEIASDFADAYGVPLDRATRAVEEVTAASEDMADAGGKAGDGISSGASIAGDSLSELGSIAHDVLEGDFAAAGESAASTVAGLAGSIPGVGIAAGIAATAVGILFKQMQADAEATEKRIRDMYDDMINSGNRFLSDSFIQKGIGEIAGDPKKYADAQRLAKDLGITVTDAMRAMSGEMSVVNDTLSEQNGLREDEISKIEASGDSLENKAVKIDAVNAKYGTTNDALNDIARAEDSAGARFSAAQQAISAHLVDLINNAQGATVEVDELGNSLYSLPDGEQILIEADTGQATTDVSKFKGDVDQKTQPVTQKIKVQTDTSAWDNWTPATKFAKVVQQITQGGSATTMKYQPLK